MQMMSSRRRQGGLGLVELMVGITVGMIVAAGASMVAVNQINEHRRLMLETQIQQDLRTAADLLQQDLRRAGFRGLAENGVWSPPTAVGSLDEKPAQLASANPYAAVTEASDDQTTSVNYLYARLDKSTPPKYDTTGTPRANEYFGIKWDKSSHTLLLKLGEKDGQPNWQPVTDPDSIKITSFDISVSTQSVDLGDFCDKPCNPASTKTAPACPTQDLREISFTIVGEAVHDAKVKRTLTGIERVRADAISGACPS